MGRARNDQEFSTKSFSHGQHYSKYLKYFEKPYEAQLKSWLSHQKVINRSFFVVVYFAKTFMLFYTGIVSASHKN